MKTCTFFGHRNAYQTDSAALENAICEAIEVHGIRCFWCGGYGAFDSAAAQAVRRLKKVYPHIELVLVYAYLPEGKDERAETYDATLFPDGLEKVPRRFAIIRRNEWMARNCNMVIGYISHDWGGAYHAYRLAEKLGKTCINLSPPPTALR